jgi:hypothetical protein
VDQIVLPVHELSPPEDKRIIHHEVAVFNFFATFLFCDIPSLRGLRGMLVVVIASLQHFFLLTGIAGSRRRSLCPENWVRHNKNGRYGMDRKKFVASLAAMPAALNAAVPAQADHPYAKSPSGNSTSRGRYRLVYVWYARF